ncbi:MAG: zinc ribbon domain-containing protein [Gammaproteobacteria bacterium]|nr:MAG: zinc ribbon domain-containing protein [Gammaproteobacteria bacterium]
MPIFEYACRKCGHSFDALQKLDEAPLKNCPECGKPALEKLLSTPAFQVKGKHKETTRKRTGHNLDGGGSHSHSHGGHTHSHGPGCGHKH